jgi:hypothetical protein
MPIRLQCPGCGSAHDVAERLAGKVIHCPKCNAVFRVAVLDEPPAESEPAPSKRQRRRTGTPNRTPVAILAGVGGLLLVGLVAVVVIIVLRNSGSGGIIPQPGGPGILAQLPSGNTSGPIPADTVATVGLTPDPLPKPLAIPDGPRVEIPLPNPFELVYPTTATPYVGIGGNAKGGGVKRTFWDLRDGKQIGGMTLDGEKYQQFALSPDGAHLAAFVKAEPWTSFEIWSVADGRSLGKIDAAVPGVSILSAPDFAGPGQLLTIQTANKTNVVRVWDVTNGNCVHRIEVELNMIAVSVRALSPGRRFLAAPDRDNKRLIICDLKAGKVAAAWQIPNPNALTALVPWALAFSQDGRSLHLMYFSGLEVYLGTWDVSTGRGSARRIAGVENINNAIYSGTTNTGQLLECLADGKVLMAGHALIDPKTGTTIRKLSEPSFQGDARHVFGSKWVRSVGAEGDRWLIVQPCPP